MSPRLLAMLDQLVRDARRPPLSDPNWRTTVILPSMAWGAFVLAAQEEAKAAHEENTR